MPASYSVPISRYIGWIERIASAEMSGSPQAANRSLKPKRDTLSPERPVCQSVVDRPLLGENGRCRSDTRWPVGHALASAVERLERLLFSLGNFRPFIRCVGLMEGKEIRHMHMGVDDCRQVVVMVMTMRPNETVQVISYRRASSQERGA